MTQCRDVENSHHEHLSDIALQMLEKFVKNQLTEDLHDELRIVRFHFIKMSPGCKGIILCRPQLAALNTNSFASFYFNSKQLKKPSVKIIFKVFVLI